MIIVDEIAYHISNNKTDIESILSIPNRNLDEMLDKKRELEKTFEDVRLKDFNDCISRLNCLFVCSDIDSVYSWLYKKYSRNRTNYYLYELSLTGKLQWFNSDHYNRCLTPRLNADPGKEAANYWNSQKEKDVKNNLESEGLFQGIAKVVTVTPSEWNYEKYLKDIEAKTSILI